MGSCKRYINTFSDDIQMKFGLDKCTVAHFVNGKLSGDKTEATVGKKGPH